jgi:hypothetical protein
VSEVSPEQPPTPPTQVPSTQVPSTQWLPNDPWMATAPVGQYPPVDPGYPAPQVVYVQVPRKRRWPWVVGILVGITVLCCGAVGAWWQPIGAQWPAHLSVGAQAGGLVKDNSIATAIIADQLTLHMDAELKIEGSVAAKLDDPDHVGRYVLLLGATRLIVDPEGELNQAINDSRSTMDLSAVAVEDPGPLGGFLRCAHARDGQGTLIQACVWIDHGSEAVALFYGSWSLDEAAATLRAIRADVLTRH